MKSPVSKSFAIAIVVIAVIVLAVGGPAYFRSGNSSASNPCINNLRNLESAKEQWALENSKTNNAAVHWEDVLPYLSREFRCPAGGTYFLGRVGKPPTCSLGGQKHTMP